MARITEELIRKRAEHNECIIGTLEELSLHQEDIVKIEHINNWCREIQILYLQANLISKIENLNKLKKLRYLNLAINNIERIENLERCESLEKLDLTLNFIGDLESVRSLRNNHLLRNLSLTGNPCADFPNYREYVIASLPQLENLDSNDIKRSERILALQKLAKITGAIRASQSDYNRFREEQKKRLAINSSTNLDDEAFWKSSSEHSPETRVEIALRSRRARRQSQNEENNEAKLKQTVRLFAKDGQPLKVNQAKIPFDFNDEKQEEYVLTVHVYKHLDTELIDVDLQPIYVKIKIKDKIFQMAFPEEILTDKSTCQRSGVTGHLVLKMPKAAYKPKPKPLTQPLEEKIIREEKCKNEFLDVKEVDSSMDFSRIVENNQEIIESITNNEIPPLEYIY